MNREKNPEEKTREKLIREEKKQKNQQTILGILYYLFIAYGLFLPSLLDIWNEESPLLSLFFSIIFPIFLLPPFYFLVFLFIRGVVYVLFFSQVCAKSIYKVWGFKVTDYALDTSPSDNNIDWINVNIVILTVTFLNIILYLTNGKDLISVFLS
ncbi:MAG: hypothetical protein ACQESQ_11600 [Bacteroidota bacterium]